MYSRLQDANHKSAGIQPGWGRVCGEKFPDNLPPRGAYFLLINPILEAEFSERLPHQSMHGRGNVLFPWKGSFRQSTPFLENPCFNFRIQGVGEVLLPVVSNCFNRAAFHCFFAHGFLLWRFWLLEHIRVAAIVIAFKICRRSFPAQIAVDALIIHIKLASDVLSVSVCRVSHSVVFLASYLKVIPESLLEKVQNRGRRNTSCNDRGMLQWHGLISSYLVGPPSAEA